MPNYQPENQDKANALYELESLIGEIDVIANQCRSIIRDNFPEELSRCDAYQVFSFAESSNPYDVTLQKVIDDLWEELKNPEPE